MAIQLLGQRVRCEQNHLDIWVDHTTHRWASYRVDSVELANKDDLRKPHACVRTASCVSRSLMWRMPMSRILKATCSRATSAMCWTAGTLSKLQFVEIVEAAQML